MGGRGRDRASVLPRQSCFSGDGRGNVDTDSYDGAQQEAFDPDYDSVPTKRPTEPPPYKSTPGYQHGGNASYAHTPGAC